MKALILIATIALNAPLSLANESDRLDGRPQTAAQAAEMARIKFELKEERAAARLIKARHRAERKALSDKQKSESLALKSSVL